MIQFEQKNFAGYEASQAMKEIGFDAPCISYFEKEEFKYVVHHGKGVPVYRGNYKNVPLLIASPLFTQAVDWFRETHGIDISDDWLGSSFNRSEDDEPENEFVIIVSWKQSDGEWVQVYKEYFVFRHEAYNAAIIAACEHVKSKSVNKP